MHHTRQAAWLATLVVSSLLASPAPAQTLGPGVFDTPPTIVPNGTTLVSDTTLNVLLGSDVARLTLGDRLAPGTNIVVNLQGGDLSINDAFEGSTINVESGILSTLLLELSEGTAINVSGGEVQSALMLTDGAQFTLSGGTVSTASFDNPGTSAAISGGSIGRVSVGLGADLTMSAGEVQSIDAFTSKITITGGNVTEAIFSPFNSDIDISGGIFGGLTISNGSLAISGGEFGGIFVRENAPSTISGGTINGLGVGPNSPIKLFGTEFLLDGQPIPGLTPGVPYQLTERNQTLTGFFADGSPFSFDLEPDASGNPDNFFPVDANVTLHLVPEPAAALLLLVAAATPRRRARRLLTKK
ncbi:MAG: hypothetical protein AAGA92_00325 [Planctomycetota bacterium]